MTESKFQAKLIKDLHNIFRGCIVLKNDANYLQGVPDLIILYRDRWAVLECKRSATERFQPNQEYYIEKMDRMSFAKVIYPENAEEVLDELQFAFES